MNDFWKNRNKLIFFTAVVLLFVPLAGCDTVERRNDSSVPTVKNKVDENFNKTVGLLERKRYGTDKILGYASPGTPMRLPARIIRIYIAPMKSPMGRLIGEHYVWAVVNGETWWTPGEIGLDTIVPPDIYRRTAPEEDKQ